MIALLLLLAQDAPPRPELSLPPSPAQRAWLTSGAASASPADVRGLERTDEAAWNSLERWKSWAERLDAQRSPASAPATLHAQLALDALATGRSEQAWDHFAALGSDAAWMSALLPAFLPGVPLGADSSALPDGVVLAPALPPTADPSSARVFGLARLERREMKLSGLHIGEAIVDLRVAVEYDGVQVDLEHRSGGVAHASVVLPELIDFELSSAYVDWEREKTLGGPHAVTLSPETPAMTVYGRVRPVRITWPTTLPIEFDERVKRDGFEVTLHRDDVAAPRIRGFAAAVQRLTGVEVRTVELDPGALAPTSSALVLHLEPAPDRDRKLRGLAWALERFAATR